MNFREAHFFLCLFIFKAVHLSSACTNGIVRYHVQALPFDVVGEAIRLCLALASMTAHCRVSEKDLTHFNIQ